MGLPEIRRKRTPLFDSSDGHLIAIAVKDDRLIPAKVVSFDVEAIDPDYFMTIGIPVRVEIGFPSDHISKNVSTPFYRVSKCGLPKNGYIQI